MQVLEADFRGRANMLGYFGVSSLCKYNTVHVPGSGIHGLWLCGQSQILAVLLVDKTAASVVAR